MEEATIRARVRRLLETGEIPCDTPDTTWAGKGVGERCVACVQPIAANDVEFEMEVSGVSYRVHRRCHDIWQEECEPVRRS
jgi:hypothetical protein